MFVLVTSLCLAFSDADIEFDCFNDQSTQSKLAISSIWALHCVSKKFTLLVFTTTRPKSDGKVGLVTQPC